MAGPLAQAFAGYSVQRQQQIAAAMRALSNGRLRPDPKTGALAGCYTVPIGARASSSTPDRLVLVPLGPGRWLAVFAVFGHNYSIAERQVPAWLASIRRKKASLRMCGSVGLGRMSGPNILPEDVTGRGRAYVEALAQRFGVPVPEVKAEVVLASKAADYRRKGSGSLITFYCGFPKESAFEEILAHEFAHHLLWERDVYRGGDPDAGHGPDFDAALAEVLSSGPRLRTASLGSLCARTASAPTVDDLRAWDADDKIRGSSKEFDSGLKFIVYCQRVLNEVLGTRIKVVDEMLYAPRLNGGTIAGAYWDEDKQHAVLAWSWAALNEVTALHECAHIIVGYRGHDDGHGPNWRRTYSALKARYLNAVPLSAAAAMIPALPDWAILQQFEQYPQSGPEGISYFKGEIDPSTWVDCLLYRKGGRLLGVLNHFPKDIGPERKGNVLIMVHPDHRREGIGKALWEEAKRRWNVKAQGQDTTPSGRSFLDKHGALSQVKEGPVPLDYKGYFSGKATRLYITDPDAPEWDKGNFKGSEPGTVAFLDYFDDGSKWIEIGFMTVRDRFTGKDYQRQGLARRLVQRLYDKHPDKTIVWGKIMDDGAQVLKNQFRERFPGRTSSAQVRYEVTGTGGFGAGTEIEQRSVRAFVGDRKIGVLSWFTRTGLINNVFVVREYRRQGIASEMLRRAREVDPNVQHNTNLTPDGAAWSEKVGSVKTAAEECVCGHAKSKHNADGYCTDADPSPLAGRPPIDCDCTRFRKAVLAGNGIYEIDMSGISSTGCVALMAKVGGLGYWPIGWLTWDKSRHTIEGLWVMDDYRGKGIGVELLKEAEKVAGAKLKDSGEYTPEGLAWAKKRGLDPKLKKRVPRDQMARMIAQMNNSLTGGARAKRLLQKVGEKTAGRYEAKMGAKTLYRGEGTHERASYYPKVGPEAWRAGAWWTDDLESAIRYSKSTEDGVVYRIEVEEGEYQPEGGPGNYVIRDPKVRERRVLHTGAERTPGGPIDWLVRVEFGRRREDAQPTETVVEPAYLEHPVGERLVWVSAETRAEALAIAAEMVAASHPSATNPISFTGDMPTKAEIIRVRASSDEQVRHLPLNEVSRMSSWEFEVPMHQIPRIFDEYYALRHKKGDPRQADAQQQWEEQQALTASIREHGVQKPITIRNGQVVDGHHRYYGGVAARVATIPVIEERTAAAVDPPEFDPSVEGWRPTKGQFSPGKETLDPRLFDLETNLLKPDVVPSLLGALGRYWDEKYPNWRDWARVYIAGSAVSYWWDSDADLDVMIGIDLDALRRDRPQNREVSDADILATLNKGLQTDLRPLTTHLLGFETTWFCNPGAYDVRAIHPYAAIEVVPPAGEWVVHPPKLPRDWGPHSYPESTWRLVDMAIREAEEVLSLPEPDRTAAADVLYDWIHEGRRAAYSEHGGGWLDPGQVIYQALSQHPHRLLQRLYEAHKREQAERISATSAGGTYFHASDHRFAPGDRIRPGVEVDKRGLSGGMPEDSDHVWMQDDVHEIYEYGQHLYEVRPIGPVTQVFPHVYRAAGAEVIREIAATDRAEYVELAEQLRRTSAYGDFRGGTIYRGLKADFPPEVEQQILDLLAPETDPESYARWKGKGGKRVQAGEIIVRALERSHWDSEMGLGRHWSERKEMADIGARQGGRGRWGILLTATYDPADLDPEFDHTAPFMEAESEVRLKPGAQITITNVEIYHNGLQKVWYQPIQARAALGYTPFRPPPGIEIITGGDAVPGGYNGYYVAYDAATGEKMGYLDYQSAYWDEDGTRQREVKIAMVEVEPKHRRKGVATVLLRALRHDFPGVEIDPGYSTPDGSGWWRAVAGKRGTFWRVHPEGRAFGDWDATSKPFFVTEDRWSSDGKVFGPHSREWREGDPVDRGYSCFENPWHLYLYVLVQWRGLGDSVSVLRFPGERVGTGHDGEDLAVPTALPFRTTWGNFVKMLPEQPLPSSPVFAPWVAGRKEFKSWKALAEHWAWLDDGGPEQRFIIDRFARKPARV